jgi:putative IMPACT (imprinted ancient) family translation regulator
LSDVVTEKKSVFLARAAEVHSVDEAKSYLAHLLATDKKAAKATHNITAWRIQGENGVQFQDCDDDGESAAGGRLLHLLELMGVWNAMVVVTRWYGGIHLGPDRFRLINQAARDAMVKGDFTSEAPKENKDAGKKKGRK